MTEKVLLVTGASSDVGMTLLDEYAKGYDHLFLHYRTMNGRLQEISKELGDRCTLLQADLGSGDDVTSMVEILKNSPHKVSHFVHLTSASTVNVKFHKSDIELFNQMLTTNLTGVLPVLKEVVSQMIKQRTGSIVFMLSSYACNIPPRYQSPYITAKYALLGLMRSLSVDYASKGISVNAVSPDMMNTKFLADLPELIVQQHAEATPLKKNLEPIDAVRTIAFLLSDAAKMITGQNIAVTGGAF